VDLAGSERTRNTQNVGDRLKEANSINASLMVSTCSVTHQELSSKADLLDNAQTLGRCLEIMRENQTAKKKALVPFKHAKLTEMFQGFFSGQGKAVSVGCLDVRRCPSADKTI
jgi:kinesin family protein 20